MFYQLLHGGRARQSSPKPSLGQGGVFTFFDLQFRLRILHWSHLLSAMVGQDLASIHTVWLVFFTRVEVQICSGNSSSAGRAGNLGLQLRGLWTDLCSWIGMAFVEEEERAAPVVPAPVDFLKAEDSECRVRREIFQPLGLQKGSLSGKGIRNPLQIWHQNRTYLSKASPITDLWVLEHQFKKSWKIEEMLLGGFPAVNDFFPTVVLLQEHFFLC